MGIGKNKWIDTCYNEAVKQVNALGIHTTINANTLSLWNIQFCKLGKFLHPNPFVANSLRPKPLLFEYFPTSSDNCKEYILNHLDHFSVEMLRNELITKTIPKLMKGEEKERPRTDTLEYQLLKQYETKPPSYSNVRR